MNYIIKPQEAEAWEVHEGVTARILANAERMTSMYFEWAPKSRFAVHTHPHEQIGICLKGEAVLTIDGEEYVVGEGDMYYIPSNVPHAERNDTDEIAVFVDVFAPVREDLLRQRFEQEIQE